MAKSADMATNFEFPRMVSDWAGYNSSRDKTNIAENVYVRGSKNVYKKLSGTLAVRQGQKRLGVANATASPISSEYTWNTSWGATYTLVVSDTKLSVIISGVWYTLLTPITATRYVFDKWWNNTQKKDLSIFVNGNDYLQTWSGGFATVLSSAATTITKTGLTSWFQAGFDKTTFATIGDATTQFDITNPAGTTFRYTFDGTGTDPAITATSVPIGSYVLTGAQNFTAGNNGIFTVTGSGANYFEVTNAAGVVEANKTIGTGFIYTKYTKVLTIGGVTFAYTGGEDTTTLTGVTPSAAGVTVGATALSAVITYPNTPADGFANDFIKVINNQVYVGSYTSRLVYISKNTDFTDYVVPTPRAPGDPELLTLDGVGKGIGVRQGKAHIGVGTSEWAVVSFNDITVGSTLTQQTKVDVKPVALLQAPYAHEFIDTVGDSLVYLAQDKQVRSFGDFNNLFTPGYPSLSQEIATELYEETFTGGGLRCIGEFVYLTAPSNGNVYLYQVRQSVNADGNVVAERMWHAPFIWNLTRIDEISGIVYGFSNANPQVYQLWDTNQWHDDSPSDENLPYACILALSYRGEQRRQGLWSFDKNFTEGYLTEGTPLDLTINYNYQGATGAISAVINSVDLPAYLFTPNNGTAPSLGDESLGEGILGDGIVTTVSDQDALPKFKVINSLGLTNCFEWQPIFSSDTADARWEILATATNAVPEPDQNATFIINKRR